MKKGLILLMTFVAPASIPLGIEALRDTKSVALDAPVMREPVLSRPERVMAIKSKLIQIKDPERLRRMLDRLDQLQENTLALKKLAREGDPAAQEQIDLILDLVDKIVKKTVKTQ